MTTLTAGSTARLHAEAVMARLRLPAPKPARHPEHADPDTIAWNQAKEAEWLAAHDRWCSKHPADAETLAWNQAREAEYNRPWRVHPAADPATVLWNQHRDAEWQAATPTGIEGMLRDLCPAVFRRDSPLPLAIGIHLPLIELLRGEYGSKKVRRFLRAWCNRPAYLAALAQGSRFDLNGHEVPPMP